jgi:hypothetical protein
MSRRQIHDPAALRPQPAREGVDWWGTPPDLIDALVHYVLPLLPDSPVWECAAGDGRLARTIAATGRHVTTTDIAPQHPDVLLCDFLTSPPPLTQPIACTNPPFRLLDKFIARGLALLDSGQISALVLLLRCDALTAAGRAFALNRAAGIATCCWRPQWTAVATATGRWSFAWAWWLPDHAGPPVSRFLLPQHRRGDLLEGAR